MASVAMLLTIALPAISSEPVTTPEPAKTETPRANQLIQRLEEIKGMDRSEMSRLEKKSLRKEVKSIQKEMKVIKGGVYLSVGAIIIVILLLILLL